MKDKIYQAMKDTFPDFDMKGISMTLRFDSIQGWDSMNSINFQMSLESILEIDLTDAPLTGENTIRDLMLFLEDHV